MSLAGHAVHSLENIPPGDRTAEICKIVNAFIDTQRVPAADIFLGIQRDLVILRYIELPLIVKENLKGTLVYEMERYIPLPISEIYFDFQIIAEDKAAGKMTVLLIAVRKELIDPFLDNGNRPGSGISGIEPDSTALVNCLSGKPGSPAGDTYAFLFEDEGHFELGFVRQERLCYSRQVIAGETAEGLGQLVDRELELLKKTTSPGSECLEIVCCGSGRRVTELLGEREDVRPVGIDLSATGLLSENLAPAYGLALKGIHKTPMDVNLLPVALRKKISKTHYYTMFVLAGLLAVAVIGWGTSLALHQRHVAAQLEAEFRRLTAEVSVINETRAELEVIEHKVDTLNSLQQRHAPVLSLLRELSEEIPPTIWFNHLYLNDEKGDVEGYADSASALIPLLASSPLLDDVAFLSPIVKDREGKEKFRIGFNLR